MCHGIAGWAAHVAGAGVLAKSGGLGLCQRQQPGLLFLHPWWEIIINDGCSTQDSSCPSKATTRAVLYT